MSLNPSSLADAFESAWKQQSPDEAIVAMKEAKAVSQFIDQGQTGMKGVPVSAAGISGLANCLDNTRKSRPPSPEISAKQESMGIHAMLTSTITSGGKHGSGGFMSGSPGQLGSDLGKLYKDQLPSEQLVAVKKAKIIDAYVKSCTFYGCGVPPDMTPDISPIT